MRKFLFLIVVVLGENAFAQNCVDPTLIDSLAICPMIYAPVCGYNGITYDNDCIAQNLGGVTSWTDGPCSQSQCQDLSQLDFGLCDMFLGYTWNGSGCSATSGCGYVVGDIDYSPYFYQNASDCMESCGDVSTACINYGQIEQGYLMDLACGQTNTPVCGCDGVTYVDGCTAFWIGGVTTYSAGACSDSSCYVIPSWVVFGECAMPLGWALTDSGCVEMSGCSYIGQFGYDYSSFFFESSYQCGAQCISEVVLDCVDSTLIDLEVFCTTDYNPVCGCNNITYSNTCVAINYGGVTSWTPGECVNSIGETWRNVVKFFPNPVSSVLSINLPEAFKGIITVFDISGKTLMQSVLIGNSAKVDFESMAKGVYIVEINDLKNGLVHQQIIKD